MSESKSSHREFVPAKKVSKHAGRRIRQRGLCQSDFDLICDAGEEFTDGYLMSSRAVSERIGRLKAEIQRLEHLRGVVLIEKQDTFVTVYRADQRRCKRILRHGISKLQGNAEVSNEPRIS